MRNSRSFSAAVLALLVTAACDMTDQPVSPQPSETPAEAPVQDRVMNSDDEFARMAQSDVPGFAGYYLQTNGTPVVRLVDPSKSGVAQRLLAPRFIAARDGRRGVAPTPVFVKANYDFAQLKDWAEKLSFLLTQRSDVYLVDVDEVGNRVLLGVADATAEGAVRVAATQLGIPANAVATQRQEKPEMRATPRDRFTTTVGGIQIAFSNFLCTLGFNARRVSTGANIYVTNSHCTGTQYVSDGIAEYQNVVGAGNQIGNEVADRGMWACAGAGTSCRQADAAYISNNGTRAVGRGGIIRTAWGSGGGRPSSLTTIGEFDIVGRYTGSLPVNSYLDKTGRTSGSTYGIVTNSCVTIGVLRCQDISKVWSEGGDSGSPVYVWLGGTGTAENDVQLHGVMWGGPGSDFTTTYSSRLSGIEADLGALDQLCRSGC